MVSKKVNIEKIRTSRRVYGKTHSRYSTDEVPKYEFPEKMMESKVAYQLIHDELNLDGNPDLNLATFVTTWMEPEADRLIMNIPLVF